MKLCINCKFCQEKRWPYPGLTLPALCVNQNVISPYDGRGYLDPTVVRKDESLCGMDAKWFEQIEIITQPDDGKIELPKPRGLLAWLGF